MAAAFLIKAASSALFFAGDKFRFNHTKLINFWVVAEDYH